MQINDPEAPRLLKAANALIQAWMYPTMDQKHFYSALNELKEATEEANREWRLSHRPSQTSPHQQDPR